MIKNFPRPLDLFPPRPWWRKACFSRKGRRLRNCFFSSRSGGPGQRKGPSHLLSVKCAGPKKTGLFRERSAGVLYFCRRPGFSLCFYQCSGCPGNVSGSRSGPPVRADDLWQRSRSRFVPHLAAKGLCQFPALFFHRAVNGLLPGVSEAFLRAKRIGEASLEGVLSSCGGNLIPPRFFGPKKEFGRRFRGEVWHCCGRDAGAWFSSRTTRKPCWIVIFNGDRDRLLAAGY